MNNMHSKQKGSIGELAIAKELSRLGYPVFRELGDLARVDLIALVPSPVRFQVKAVSSKNEMVELDTRKSGPNYRFRYTLEDFDILAVYVLDRDRCAYLSVTEFLANSGGFKLRFSPTKNGQIKGVKMFIEFESLERVLRDYTPNTLTNNVEGDDIVQTTTAERWLGKPGVVS